MQSPPIIGCDPDVIPQGQTDIAQPCLDFRMGSITLALLLQRFVERLCFRPSLFEACGPGSQGLVFLVAGRRELRALIRGYLAWIDGPAGGAATPEEAIREIADADCYFGNPSREIYLAAKKLRWIQAPSSSRLRIRGLPRSPHSGAMPVISMPGPGARPTDSLADQP